MRSIQDLSARLNRLTDVRAIGEAIVTEARTLADYHDIRIYRVDRERGVCDPIAFTREMLDGQPEDPKRCSGWPSARASPAGWPSTASRSSSTTRSTTRAARRSTAPTTSPSQCSLVPMLYEGEALGVIVLSQLGFNRFTDDDLQTMRIFAGYAAQAMANAQTYEQLVAQSTELARRADSQRRLLEINERLRSTLDQAGVLETVADGLRDVVSYDNLSIYRTDHEKRES